MVISIDIFKDIQKEYLKSFGETGYTKSLT